MVAQYRVLRTTFIAPHKLKAGDIIETESPAGDHLEPLNDEAKKAMEVYYTKKVEVLDPETGKIVRTVYPNKDKRPVAQEDRAPATVSLVRREEFDEAPLVGVTQERILAGKPGELEPSEEPAPKVLSVDQPK